MTALFEPKGPKSQRQMLVDVVKEHSPGDVLEYGVLQELLRIPSRRGVQAAVNGAKPSIERVTKRCLVAEPNEGYRIISAAEHYDRAVVHQKKARRQTKRALSKVKNVKMGELTVEQRAMATAAVTALSLQADFERRADLKYARKEELKKLAEEQELLKNRSAEESKRMDERVARLEAIIRKLPKDGS